MFPLGVRRTNLDSDSSEDTESEPEDADMQGDLQVMMLMITSYPPHSTLFMQHELTSHTN